MFGKRRLNELMKSLRRITFVTMSGVKVDFVVEERFASSNFYVLFKDLPRLEDVMKKEDGVQLIKLLFKHKIIRRNLNGKQKSKQEQENGAKG